MKTVLSFTIAILILILINIILLCHSHNNLYNNHLNGFWVNDENEENNIIIYMNNNDMSANIILGKDDKILSDLIYSYKLNI